MQPKPRHGCKMAAADAIVFRRRFLANPDLPDRPRVAPSSTRMIPRPTTAAANAATRPYPALAQACGEESPRRAWINAGRARALLSAFVAGLAVAVGVELLGRPLDAHLRGSVVEDAQLSSRFLRQVNIATGHVRAAVVDLDLD